MPDAPPPTRRRNAPTAHESGAERSEFGRRATPPAAPPRRNARRNGAPASERHRRPSGAPSPAAGIHALADTSRFRRSALQASRTPFRRRDASSFEKRRRASPFLVRTWRGQYHFRWKLRASVVTIRGERRRSGHRRQRPGRRRAAQGVEDQNESGDCRARARPLMSRGELLRAAARNPRRRAARLDWPDG